jgi:alpha-beta hydrolase superfamily lysophospholipase
MSRLLPKLRLGTPIARGQLSRDRAVEDAYFSDPLVQTSATTRLGDEVFRAMAATTAALSNVRVPTYVLHGGSDTVVPTRFSEPLASLENVTRKVYADLRHESFNEPEGPDVVRELVAWIDERLPS